MLSLQWSALCVAVVAFVFVTPPWLSGVIEWTAVEWWRSLPLADELRSYQASSFVTDVEVPLIVTKGVDLRSLERDRAVLEIRASDAGSKLAAKVLGRRLEERKHKKHERREWPTFAVSNPCGGGDGDWCDPKSKRALEGAEALVLRCEDVKWPTPGGQVAPSSSPKVTLFGRFLERGRLEKVHAPLEGSTSLWFASLFEHRVGDLVARKRGGRRGVVLFVQWPTPTTTPPGRRKEEKPKEFFFEVNFLAGALASFARNVFVATVKDLPDDDDDEEKGPPLARPSYVVLAESSGDDDQRGLIERWSHDGVVAAGPHSAFPVVLDSKFDVRLERDPTATSRANVDRDSFFLGEGFAVHVLQHCRRGACFLVRAPHKGVPATTLARLAVYGAGTLYLAASATAPKPPSSFTLVRRAFASHGCCPPAKLDLYDRQLTAGVLELPTHGLVAQGPESHTYIYVLHLAKQHDDPMPPFRHRLLDTFFEEEEEDPPLGNRHRYLVRSAEVVNRRQILANNISLVTR